MRRFGYLGSLFGEIIQFARQNKMISPNREPR